MDFKKVIILLVISLSLNLTAQDTPGNLQFNRVVNFSETILVSYDTRYAALTPVTIDEGKVLKITNLTVMLYEEIGSEKYLSAPSNCSASIGGVTVYSNTASVRYDYNINNSIFPVWLNSGQKEFLVFGVGSHKVTYTAIEFNIIQ